MALYEHYEAGADGIIVYGAGWLAQTFTPAVTHTITAVRLYPTGRLGSPGTGTVSIKATDGANKPTGADLASGTFNGDTITLANWLEITLGAGTKLTALTQYAMVIRLPSGNGSNYLTFSLTVQVGGAHYSGGLEGFSSDSGATWTMNADNDVNFEEYGLGPLAVTTQAPTNIASTTATGNGTITSTGYSAVTQHGHCWATTVDPTTADSKTSNGAGSAGAFISAITGLVRGTKYYVRAYATNTEGTAYGSNVSFLAGFPYTIALEGQIAVVETRFHYVGADGKEYYLQGTLIP